MRASLPIMPDEDLARVTSSSPADADSAGFGALLTGRGSLPLASMDVVGRIDGLLSRVTVRQVFVNALDEPLEATYIFPLPDRAAVNGFRMEVGGRIIDGVLEERGKAREQYDQAISEGKRAAIAEEDRPGVFNLRVGNLMPGERATIELNLCGVLPYGGGEVTFRFPLVVAPRYIPGTPLAGPSVGDGTAVDTDAVPDASRITPPVLLAGFPNPVRLSLEVELHDGCSPAHDLRCSLHAVRDEPCEGCRRIRLDPGERLDRDFILRFRLGDRSIRSTLTLHPDSSDRTAGTFALTVVPPIATPTSCSRPRAVVFVLDRSGSMEGWKIVAARRAMARMIDTLSDTDRFCVLAFDSVTELPPGLVAGLTEANDRNRFRAVEYLSGLGARGGTEMAGPLDRAVKLLSEVSPEERERVLVLVTDGQVGNEDQILATLGRKLKGIRVFTLGIDQAVNEAFLRRLAERGGGACELVESEQRLDEVMQSVHRRIGAPLLTGLFLEGEGLAIEPGEVVPRRLPDLFSGSPLLILGRYRGRAEGSLAIRATDTAGRAWSESVQGMIRDNPAIASAWARGQIRQIEDRYAAGDGDRTALERAIVAISLKFQVLCRFTAYVAIDRSQTANQHGSLHRVVQPVEMPAGWDVSSAYVGGLIASRKSRGETRKYRRSSPQYEPVPDATHYSSPESANVCRAPVTASSWDALETIVDAVSQETPPCGKSSPDLPTDRFEIGEILGTGGMGRVYRAHDRDVSREVCLKIVEDERFGPETLERWRRQKEVLERLNHPAIPPAIEVGNSGESFWVATPRFKGRTLAERLRSSGPLPPRAAATLIAVVAEVLQFVHERGLAHRDLTPSNIFLGDDGQTRLFGFGEVPLEADDASSPGRVIGTPAYMPPELARGEAGVNPVGIDVYALGVILYEILTGQVPFSGTNIVDLLRKILDEKPKPLRKIARSIPAALESICLKAISKKPTDRYATAGELAAALRGFMTPARRRGFWKAT
jgi:Ca-activated chloride channel family protein